MQGSLFENLPISENTSEKNNFGIIIQQQWFSINQCKANPEKLYVFGDNMLRRGNAGQAQIRYCENATGLATKCFPSLDEKSFFSDEQFENCCEVIRKDIEKIKLRYKNGGYTYIVFPEDGLGTGLSQLPKRAPRVYDFLKNILLEEFGVSTNDLDHKLGLSGKGK